MEAQFKRYNIDYSFTDGLELKDFEVGIKNTTKVIYIETPSNPLLKIVDIQNNSSICKIK